ncbi:hypothetical protein [Streptomyces sp. NPDC058157]|uniref:hypothetical protein n=1 Tax=Streptomyces sp. NPDC058157 TaxID=3346360 RepID=UPI0036E4B033
MAEEQQRFAVLGWLTWSVRSLPVALSTPGLVDKMFKISNRRHAKNTFITGAAGLTLAGAVACVLSLDDSPVGAQAAGAPVEMLSGDDIGRVLASFLPKGADLKVVGIQGTHDAKQGGERAAVQAPTARIVVDEGTGPGLVGIGFGHGDVTARNIGCPLQGGNPDEQCERTELPDGGVLVVSQGYERPSERQGPRMIQADMYTKEGRQVSVYTLNAAEEKSGTVTRSRTPLTAQQLKEIATSPKWDAVLAGLPASDAAKSAARPAGEPLAADIEKVVRGLLPAGVSVAETSGQDGFLEALLHDGKGDTHFQINVQRLGGRQSGGVYAELYDGAERTPDGTRVKVTEEPAEKGGKNAVEWTVDTVRADGLRVVVTVTNSTGPYQDANRSTPALTVDQLKRLALDKAWDGITGR